MLRLAFARSASLARTTGVARLALGHPRFALKHVRYESSTASPEQKDMGKATNEPKLGREARIIAYEELKPKTSQPSPVRRHFL